MKEGRRQLIIDRTATVAYTHARKNIAPATGFRLAIRRVSHPTSPDSGFDLDQFKDLSHTDNIRVTSQSLEKGRRVTKSVTLPQSLLDNLAQYIREGKQRDPRNNCATLIHNLYGLQKPRLFNIDFRKWDFQQLTKPALAQLKPGDPIAFLGPSQQLGEQYRVPHMAFYLGDNLYLSQGGSGRGLAVMDLKNMLDLYPAQYVMKIKPSKTSHPSTAHVRLNPKQGLPI